jgi:hypothetical protein
MAKPKLITRAGLARGVARRWQRTYCRGDRWYTAEMKSIHERLVALADPTPEQINAIIGNDSWTNLCCDGCDRQVEAVVRVGSEDEIDAPSSALCEPCVRAALAAFAKEPS